MILLQANRVSRYFGAETLFENVQMEIHKNSRIALVGRNGAGKSTLLKMIAGVELPDGGQITKSKTVTLGYLAQNAGFDSKKTIWEEMKQAFHLLIQMEDRIHELEQLISQTTDTVNLDRIMKEYDQLQQTFLEKNGYGYENDIRSILHGFGFYEDSYHKPINTLSGGQKTRLALVRMLLQKPDILVLDEPTNHLDIETLAWLETYLSSYTGALLIVSHDRYFLDKIVTEVYELSRKKLNYYKGNYSDYLKLKAGQLEADWKAYQKQQAEINKLEDFVARNLARASTTKRAQSRQKALEKMDRMERPIGDEKSAHFLFDFDKASGNVVLQVKDAAIGYNKQQILADSINIDINKQDAIALVGPNGIGKSTLLKSIMDQLPFIKGIKILGTNVSIGYYDQEQANLTSSQTVLEELWSEHSTVPETEIRKVLGSFLFSGEDVEKTIPLLSGGEKARVALAKLAMNKNNFLILDEPTNHLDIDSKEVLENALIDYEGTLLFVSHDRYFINRVATKVIDLSENGCKLYLGDYDYYLEKKKEEEEIAELLGKQSLIDVPVDTPTKNDFYLQKEQQKIVRSLQRKITQIEEELTELEERIDQLQIELVNPVFMDDAPALTELTEKLSNYQHKQEDLLDEWENLSLELEEQQT
ncbi:ABC-F family ATP-binding cassette domain-containing protein [Melissococcus plutonius]|uniref:ABC transporter ATP-binding protein Uup n=1 Tax=Melissococcus plutonius (strain ATCC 35311 / DSM 29964 / CIP 104052 / LMG 20360 / NCIMB 702443) TaxID=940190 RepID=F3YBY7_MELPT|nr:ABC-F type ribosomal protection protein [Melissococcus plutonius]AIM25281.1 putative ABC transporter ATP-binding protein [Melissococcus plutonius S1]KMT23966.1 putative ABC transporter ATP-binding protein [Melissococcus plutonius]KMT24489.1 putative ABC transporter ATP-binding protein [Melissococcus plutonius]KMT26062.1 putative ABC transporter ATP-binding protein [Melissococcus plutonius]KMT28611.1 putative ABC transporter ATP-binding protein [Melissococcus plutonius]